MGHPHIVRAAREQSAQDIGSCGAVGAGEGGEVLHERFVGKCLCHSSAKCIQWHYIGTLCVGGACKSYSLGIANKCLHIKTLIALSCGSVALIKHEIVILGELS